MIVTIKGGIVIGELLPQSHAFLKRVQFSRHLFKKFDAWGMDAEYFTEVLLPGNYEIRVFDSEERKIYVTTAEKWKKEGQHFHFKKAKDYRAQIFLSRKFFDVQSIDGKGF